MLWAGPDYALRLNVRALVARLIYNYSVTFNCRHLHCRARSASAWHFLPTKSRVGTTASTAADSVLVTQIESLHVFIPITVLSALLDGKSTRCLTVFDKPTPNTLKSGDRRSLHHSQNPSHIDSPRVIAVPQSIRNSEEKPVIIVSRCTCDLSTRSI
jgi:hypothetical protein